MQLFCRNCVYLWNYTGKRNPGQVTSCPGCGRRVRIREYTEEEIAKVKS